MSVSSITSDLNASIMLYGNTVINNFMTQPCFIFWIYYFIRLLTAVKDPSSRMRRIVQYLEGFMSSSLCHPVLWNIRHDFIKRHHGNETSWTVGAWSSQTTVMELEETVWSTSVQHRLYTLMCTLMYTLSPAALQWQGGWQTVSSWRCTVSIIVAGVQVACLDRHAYRCYTPPPAMS